MDELTHPDRHRPGLNQRGLSLLLASLPAEGVPPTAAVTDNDKHESRDVTDRDECRDIRNASDMTDVEIQEEIQLLRSRLMTLTVTLQYRGMDDQPTNARRRQPLPPRTCAVCETEYQPKRRDSQYCSGRCRQRAHRRRNGSQKDTRVPFVEVDSGLVVAPLAEHT